MLKKTLILVSLLLLPWTVSAQFYSLRTNVAALATGNLNAEFSMTLNRKWSVHLPLQYCPFKFNANRQWRNIYTSPGVRYWLRESYTGGFIGLHGVAAGEGLVDADGGHDEEADHRQRRGEQEGQVEAAVGLHAPRRELGIKGELTHRAHRLVR